MNLAETITSNMRQIREAKGLSQEELGKLCRPPISQQMIGRLEKGERKMTANYMEALADALGVSAIDLIVGQADEAPKAVRLDEQVANELARTLGRVALGGEEPEPGTWQALSAMLQELTATFLANPEVYSDPRVARPVLDFAARRYARAS